MEMSHEVFRLAYFIAQEMDQRDAATLMTYLNATYIPDPRIRALIEQIRIRAHSVPFEDAGWWYMHQYGYLRPYFWWEPRRVGLIGLGLGLGLVFGISLLDRNAARERKEQIRRAAT